VRELTGEQVTGATTSLEHDLLLQRLRGDRIRFMSARLARRRRRRLTRRLW
jgi:hypothetical protein